MSSRIRTIAARLLLAAVAGLAVPACGGSSASPPDRAAAAVDASALSEITRLTTAITEAQRAAVRQCMADRGFPQLIEAERLAVTLEPLGRHDSVRIDPLDLGPYTEEQARRHGIVGTALLFTDGEPGSVISADAAYDAAERTCRTSLNKRTNADVEALLASATSTQNRVRADFSARVRPAVDELVRERLRCTAAAGYPALDVDGVMASATLEDSLESIGVPPGKLVKDHPERPHLHKGEVIVVAPPKPATYTPSAGEVAFALAYVECGDKSGLVARLEEIQQRPRAETLAHHELELVALTKELEKTTGALDIS